MDEKYAIPTYLPFQTNFIDKGKSHLKKIQKAVFLVTSASCDVQINYQSEQSILDISTQANDRARSLSDSGFESRDSVKTKFRKFSVAPAIEKQKLAKARKL